MGNLKKDGLALWSETKMAPGGRDRGVVYVKVFDWLLISMHVDSAWAQQTPVIMKAHDDLTFNVIGATMASPLQTPLACLYKPRVCGNTVELPRWNSCRICLSLAHWGAGLADSRLISPRDPSALLREVSLPLFLQSVPCKVLQKDQQNWQTYTSMNQEKREKTQSTKIRNENGDIDY